jgi:hypothetical protein
MHTGPKLESSSPSRWRSVTRRFQLILLWALAFVGVASLGLWGLGLVFGRYPERYEWVDRLNRAFTKTPLLEEIVALRKLVLEKTPAELGLLPIKGSEGRTYALPRHLLPASLPTLFRPTSDEWAVLDWPLNRVFYDENGKVDAIYFERSRAAIFVPISRNHPPAGVTTTLLISDNPYVYVGHYGAPTQTHYPKE